MISNILNAPKHFVSTFGYAIVAIFATFAVAVPASAQSHAGASETSEVRALFANWRQDERQRRGVMAIPSVEPVTDRYRLSSNFGMRTHPILGGRRMHNGVDMAAPIGTPIYATADGIVGRAQWLGGYGKYVEINHGGGIQTRYGHLSRILVEPGARVTRGQMIGHMGSTGRSTGSHLHYEVRISGRAVNPMPFMTSDNYLAQMAAADTATETSGAGVGGSQ
ncbi:M23 family metallopeptidase [Parasphingopyxis sp.]|uniref:M23 family metallopeptidase n=1 Tax=Parasphingopyxis sp. TaxID=1920299 RepID=UPI00261E6542|nr:M23 family metallopeptidase [Parasphingopyxis sp.]